MYKCTNIRRMIEFFQPIFLMHCRRRYFIPVPFELRDSFKSTFTYIAHLGWPIKQLRVLKIVVICCTIFLPLFYFFYFLSTTFFLSKSHFLHAFLCTICTWFSLFFSVCSMCLFNWTFFFGQNISLFTRNRHYLSNVIIILHRRTMQKKPVSSINKSNITISACRKKTEDEQNKIGS